MELDRLKMDYEQTARYFHATADVRFKLLALVPVVTGATIALLGRIDDPGRVIPVEVLGLLATLEIVFYDQRNTQIYNAMQVRAKSLEVLLELPAINRQEWRYGGAFLDRPPRSLYLFGRILMWHDRGLALIYATALGGWTYLLLGGVVNLLKLPPPIALSVTSILPILIVIAFFCQLEAFDKATDVLNALPADIQRRLDGG